MIVRDSDEWLALNAQDEYPELFCFLYFKLVVLKLVDFLNCDLTLGNG